MLNGFRRFADGRTEQFQGGGRRLQGSVPDCVKGWEEREDRNEYFIK